MKIFISDGTKRIIIEANENDYIKTLKEKIKFETGANERINLFFRGKILKDDEKLSKYSIKECNTILMRKEAEIYCAGGGLKIFIGNPTGISRPLYVIIPCRVFDLKKQIKNQEGIKGDIELTFNGIILEDSELLSDIGIEEGMTIEYIGCFRAGCYEFKKIRLN